MREAVQRRQRPRRTAARCAAAEQARRRGRGAGRVEGRLATRGSSPSASSWMPTLRSWTRTRATCICSYEGRSSVVGRSPGRAAEARRTSTATSTSPVERADSRARAGREVADGRMAAAPRYEGRPAAYPVACRHRGDGDDRRGDLICSSVIEEECAATACGRCSRRYEADAVLVGEPTGLRSGMRTPASSGRGCLPGGTATRSPAARCVDRLAGRSPGCAGRVGDQRAGARPDSPPCANGRTE